MSRATIEADRVGAETPTVDPRARTAAVSSRAVVAVGAALLLGLGGAVWIVSPKASESTDAAYIQATVR